MAFVFLIVVFYIDHYYPGLAQGCDLGKVFLSWPTSSPYFELREKFKCIDNIGNIIYIESYGLLKIWAF